MLSTNYLPRVFLFSQGGTELKLKDPENRYTPEQVKHFYSGSYPILTNAQIEGPNIKDDEMQYRFVTTLGTKG